MEDMEMTNVEPETEVVDSSVATSSNGTNYGLILLGGAVIAGAVIGTCKVVHKYIYKPVKHKLGEWWETRQTKKAKKIVPAVQKDDAIDTDPATMVIEDPVVEESKK